MNAEQALQLLTQITAQVTTDRKTHLAILQAIEVLKTLVNEEK